VYPFGYTKPLYQLRQTETFGKWLATLRDARAKARILARVESVRLGNLGDIEPVGGSVIEMRVHVGAGYRVYCVRRGVIIVLLCGGDKSTQRKDIAQAKALVHQLAQE